MSAAAWDRNLAREDLDEREEEPGELETAVPVVLADVVVDALGEGGLADEVLGGLALGEVAPLVVGMLIPQRAEDVAVVQTPPICFFLVDVGRIPVEPEHSTCDKARGAQKGGEREGNVAPRSHRSK